MVDVEGIAVTTSHALTGVPPPKVLPEYTMVDPFAAKPLIVTTSVKIQVPDVVPEAGDTIVPVALK